VAAVVEHPEAVPRDLDDAFPTSRAYLAYAATVGGRADEAALRFDDAVKELAGDVAAQRQPNEHPPTGWSTDAVARAAGPPLTRALRLVRLSVEDLHGHCRAKWDAAQPGHATEFPNLPPLFPCRLFEKHPRDATDALRPIHGDVNDILALMRRGECAEELLDKSAPAAEANAAVGALRALEAAVIRAGRPRPSDGYALDEWVSRSYAARELIQDEVLAPGLLRRGTPASEALADAVAKATRETRATPARVAAFKAVLAAQAPALATGICAVAASRRVPMTADRCAERARDAASYALADWLTWGE
jgi:hypothetical protein